eukprot:GHVR01100015.1.p2 GENE.GHVR01100015.1~~GHVR01100015.1.p2  ORF type:complete len:122 (+),score=9.58 GHVR01100015.1:107-472(+)
MEFLSALDPLRNHFPPFPPHPCVVRNDILEQGCRISGVKCECGEDCHRGSCPQHKFILLRVVQNVTHEYIRLYVLLVHRREVGVVCPRDAERAQEHCLAEKSALRNEEQLYDELGGEQCDA